MSSNVGISRDLFSNRRATKDQGDEPLKVGRADALNSRTQDYFDMLGILPSLQELGLKCNSERIKPIDEYDHN